MREPSTPCTLEHPTGSDRRTSTFAEPLARRSDAQNPLSATARLRSRLLIARAVPRIPQEPLTDHHTRPKNHACEKCGLMVKPCFQRVARNGFGTQMDPSVVKWLFLERGRL
jgi:hypothetical protein